MNPLHLTAHALGVHTGQGCDCAFCGASPFAPTGALKKISGAVLALRRHPANADLCAGCAAVLGGKPGRVPPPLRMQNVVVTDGQILFPARNELRDVILSPPPAPFVASWATSKKKHHVLHAGLSSPDRQIWGSDDGPIMVTPDHVELLATVEQQLQHHTRTALLTGHYSTPAIAKQGHPQWDALEQQISTHRGQRVLDLLVFAAEKTKPESAPTVGAGPLFQDAFLQEGFAMIDPVDQQSADLLSYIAQGSQYRVEHGLDFWNGYFRSRIERHAHRPLAEMVSRLLDECQCSSTGESIQEVMHAVTLMDEDATKAVEHSIRTRAALLTSLAFTAMKDKR